MYHTWILTGVDTHKTCILEMRTICSVYTHAGPIKGSPSVLEQQASCFITKTKSHTERILIIHSRVCDPSFPGTNKRFITTRRWNNKIPEKTQRTQQDTPFLYLSAAAAVKSPVKQGSLGVDVIQHGPGVVGHGGGKHDGVVIPC